MGQVNDEEFDEVEVKFRVLMRDLYDLRHDQKTIVRSLLAKVLSVIEEADRECYGLDNG